jgi:hypothetical protein
LHENVEAAKEAQKENDRLRISNDAAFERLKQTMARLESQP